ncbi:hypothetical protein NQZ68_021033 [Dissostichus eleginoides]|nr:hypothetical protein NQZ68_021033 [Dissostichus eleginoides]
MSGEDGEGEEGETERPPLRGCHGALTLPPSAAHCRLTTPASASDRGHNELQRDCGRRT